MLGGWERLIFLEAAWRVEVVVRAHGEPRNGRVELNKSSDLRRSTSLL